MDMSLSRYPGNFAMHTQVALQQIEPILTQSIQQYERILVLLRKIDEVTGTASPAELLELSETLVNLQSQATQSDNILVSQLSKYPARTETLQSLIEKREHIIKEILCLNERITVKASGVKSLIAHEMGKLRHGLSALSGYRQQQHNQGRIVNSTS